MNEVKYEQQICLKEGKSLLISGVNSILGFDEGFLKLDTSLGIINVEGKDLVIENLIKDKREITVYGTVSLIEIKSKDRKK